MEIQDARLKIIEFHSDKERALYGIKNADLSCCTFAGPVDGESALKEAKHINLDHCKFELRYPLWHVDHGQISNSFLSETCRAPLWYCRDVLLEKTRVEGTKTLRECNDVIVKNCDINSDEFAWMTDNIKVFETKISGKYCFLKTNNLVCKGLKLEGKYSFQYVKKAHIKDSFLDTKDAFWHAENIVVEDSIVKGEYLGWYSKNLKFVRCTIIGTQPLCYAKGLELIDCKMIDCDLCFEKSQVKATILGEVLSVKNPTSGYIKADLIGEIINDDRLEHEVESTCIIEQKCMGDFTQSLLKMETLK